MAPKIARSQAIRNGISDMYHQHLAESSDIFAIIVADALEDGKPGIGRIDLIYGSARNSYSSMTAATATLPSPSSTRTTLPLQRTRMLSVRVISGGRVSVNSIMEPGAMAEST